MPLLKPSACDGCPARHLSPFWVPDEIHEGAEVTVLGQNPGANEERGRKLEGYDNEGREIWVEHPPAPYIGKTGHDMESNYFPLAGLQREKVNVCNAIRCRFGPSDKLPPVQSTLVRGAIEHCHRVHGMGVVGPNTKLVIAEGEYALYAATQEDGSESPGFKISRGISGWRGWLLPWNPPPRPREVHTQVYAPGVGSVPVLPTYHLAYLYRNPWERPTSRRDWSKVQQILKGTWPEPFPFIERTPPNVWPAKSAFDTEFYTDDKGKSHLIRWSLAARPLGGYGGKPASLWVVEYDRDLVVPVSGVPRIWFHNIEADIEHVARLLGNKRILYDDTMYEHAVLWPDLDHDLDFVGSIYARTNRWKHLVHTNPVVYSGGDALGTLDIALSLEGELERDPRSRWVYENLQRPLIPIINKALQPGQRVHQGRAQRALQELDALQQELKLQAQAAVGWPINLGSDDQVREWLYDVEHVDVNPITGRKRRFFK